MSVGCGIAVRRDPNLEPVTTLVATGKTGVDERGRVEWHCYVTGQMKQPAERNGFGRIRRVTSHDSLVLGVGLQDILTGGQRRIRPDDALIGGVDEIHVMPRRAVVGGGIAHVVGPPGGQHEQVLVALVVAQGRIVKFSGPPSLVVGVLFQDGHYTGNGLW